MQKTISTEDKSKKVFFKKKDEKILVVPTKTLFPNGATTGIEKINFEQYQNLIENNKQFLWRSQMELDQNYKQIIPYLIFSFEDKLFLMQRKKSSSERRLQSLYSLGIGGHIRQEDIQSGSIFDWAKREFHEEINYTGKFELEPIGLLNDETNEVGKVHTGFIFLLTGNSKDISIKSELQHGSLLTLKECNSFYSKMENWSKLVFNYLYQKRKEI